VCVYLLSTANSHHLSSRWGRVSRSSALDWSGRLHLNEGTHRMYATRAHDKKAIAAINSNISQERSDLRLYAYPALNAGERRVPMLSMAEKAANICACC
jgi:hypothetical protein